MGFSIISAIKKVHISHKTYHHFTGSGNFDSNLDKILHSSNVSSKEVVTSIICKLENPLIDSHHDLIISSWNLPIILTNEQPHNPTIAPRMTNTRNKIVWSGAGVDEYQKLVGPHLSRLRDFWLSSPTKSSVSVLFNTTNHILSCSATLTNKYIDLSKKFKPRSSPVSRQVKQSKSSVLKLHKKLRDAVNSNAAPSMITSLEKKLKGAKADHRKLVRAEDVDEEVKRNNNLHDILTRNPSSFHKAIRNSKNSLSSGNTQKLVVGGKVYLGEQVADGFFDSLKSLKSIDQVVLDDSETYSDFKKDYINILELCRSGKPVPEISEKKAFEILKTIKPEVNDLYSITAKHYLNAGPSGITHFRLLINTFLQDVSLLTITEINRVYATILFKGHQKDKSSDRSYRTISICPLVAKGVDLYVKDINMAAWRDDQAETQYQGEGSSHELAALLLTETIQFSLFNIKQPIFILYLDARSAFDVVLRELLIKNLYHCGTDLQSLLIINNRLSNRSTCLEWDKQLVGPIMDECGVEQGGVNSSEFYKIFGKDQLSNAQDSELGVSMNNVVISAIGLADDTGLLANCPHALQNLLQLSLNFCKKYHVELSHEKTKLQVMSTKPMKIQTDYLKSTAQITINDTLIKFVESAEHVGIVRSTTGNLPHILDRFTAHKQALGKVLHAGLARHHHGNPAAGLRVDQLHGIPVLLSGVGALVLKRGEIDMIDLHHKHTIEGIMRLHPGTPQCVSLFLAGSLGGKALVHLRQLSIFGMICRLPDSILYKHAAHTLTTSKPSFHSWFSQIRDICLQYNLPHPLGILKANLTKDKFKILVKQHVINYWELKLRAKAAVLPSLEYFKADYLSLASPHPIFTTAGPNRYAVTMASVQGVMLSGRYRTEALASHWSESGSKYCKIPSCNDLKVVEDLKHILAKCDSLTSTRGNLLKFTVNYCKTVETEEVRNLILTYTNTEHPVFCQFIVDCSVLPDVIKLCQKYDRGVVLSQLFRVTRTWCYCLHRERMKVLGRWQRPK